ncbi:MAG: DUF6694 family lipoprotein [Desulfosalsimonadaceae bacterium]
MKLFIFLFVAISLVGCSQPTVDASSDESMKTSIAKVRESLPAEKRIQFDEALQLMAFGKIDLKSIFTEGAAGVGNLKGKMKDAVHGKTGEQIIAEAAQIKTEEEVKSKERDFKKIAELEEKKAQENKILLQLNQLEVKIKKFYKSEVAYTSSLKADAYVKNNSKKAISGVRFEGTLKSPDRSVPWGQDTFDKSISGGLEPNEEATWELYLPRDWNYLDYPENTILTVKVVRLWDANEESIGASDLFSKWDEKELKELKSKYNLQ